MAIKQVCYFDWSDMAFASKKPLRELDAIFIAAPREISIERIKQLIKTYLPKANVVIGIAQEPYILGLEDQPQFKTLQLESVLPIMKKVNAASAGHKLYTLNYSQRDTVFIYEKISFKEVLLINGSWYHGFHHLPEYYALTKSGIKFTKLSPFSSEDDAKSYASATMLTSLTSEGIFTEQEMMELANKAATHSFDYAGFQTGGSLGLKKGNKYNLVSTAHNRIVPYETYAMHHGSQRETHYSPLNDLNYYDTIHYEVSLMIDAMQRGFTFDGLTMFQTVLSCPHCARMLCATNIEEIVYQQDHSDGYAIKLLAESGKTVRRCV